ncbi:hypothetical protein D3C71_2146220 [compost metagenome]
MQKVQFQARYLTDLLVGPYAEYVGVVQGLRFACVKAAAEQAYRGQRRFAMEHFKNIHFMVKHSQCCDKGFFYIAIHNLTRW